MLSDFKPVTGGQQRAGSVPVLDDLKQIPLLFRGERLRAPAGETILVVKDEQDLRTYAVEALCDLGYRVLEAAARGGALELSEKSPEIELLFTDVVLRGGMNGRVLADEVTRRNLGLLVLYTADTWLIPSSTMAALTRG
jgi:CheY-like chemotaxis protein